MNTKALILTQLNAAECSSGFALQVMFALCSFGCTLPPPYFICGVLAWMAKHSCSCESLLPDTEW